MCVVAREVFDVAVDLRKNSPNFRKVGRLHSFRRKQTHDWHARLGANHRRNQARGIESTLPRPRRPLSPDCSRSRNVVWFRQSNTCRSQNATPGSAHASTHPHFDRRISAACTETGQFPPRQHPAAHRTRPLDSRMDRFAGAMHAENSVASQRLIVPLQGFSVESLKPCLH